MEIKSEKVAHGHSLFTNLIHDLEDLGDGTFYLAPGIDAWFDEEKIGGDEKQ